MDFDAITALRSFGVLGTDATARAEPLAGGFWNDIVRLRCGDQDLVVKHFGARSAR